jgi:hypothetical protein
MVVTALSVILANALKSLHLYDKTHTKENKLP